ncbi:MAG TPA: ABC-F family ATP-binding cassette domain-containing protein [Bacteroidia bacterium]|jgi:ATP-binding cassette subfamily F protein uup|nr:ABC-F family ATP-binding cassette domain-containing protein [Bacteroidia bacterium]
MNLLSVENLSKSYSDKQLFTNISFGIEHGQRVALVARNGAGKSTLLRILSKEDIADKGIVTFRNDINISFLEQEPVFRPNDTVYQALFHSGNVMQKAISNYEIALEKNEEDPSEANQKLLEKAMEDIEANDAWNYENKVKQILTSLNIHHLEQQVSSLSGGEKKRLAVARVLIEEPHLLIMDEPTNHLDLEMIEWLENYFVRNDVSLLVVTHDRYFLDNVCTDILELDNGNLYHYKGNYEYFIQKKAERELNESKELERANNLYRRELEWVRKMPRARGTKSKSRVDAFTKLDESLSGRKKQSDLQLSIKMSRIGGKILELKNIKKKHGEKVILKGFDYTFKKGERIGIAGKNGAGKTTFLNIITGLEQADSGKVNVGETIVFGYYSQKGMNISDDKRVIEVIKEIGEYIPMGDGTKLSASQLLLMFQFSAEMQYTYVSKLSGGEKKRLYLLTVLMKNPNFLILDEPTNDLDLITLSTLEQFLLDFPGCLIIVSHDRYFMDKLADELFILTGDGNVKIYNGKYTDYREEEKENKKLEAQQKTKETLTPTIETTKERNKPKASYKEKFEFETLEKEIVKLEKQKAALTEEINNSETTHENLIRASKEFGQLSKLIDEKQMRWLELSELIG